LHLRQHSGILPGPAAPHGASNDHHHLPSQRIRPPPLVADDRRRVRGRRRLHPQRRSRRPRAPGANLRRTLDAIFWIAASKHPWRALPPELGKPDSAHRTLRRWAGRGVLDRLLMALTTHPLAGATPALRSMA
jgi:transposase